MGGQPKTPWKNALLEGPPEKPGVIYHKKLVGG